MPANVYQYRPHDPPPDRPPVKLGARTNSAAGRREQRRRIIWFIRRLSLGDTATRAVEAVGLSLPVLYKMRSYDTDLDEAWRFAVESGVDRLEDEARRRAVDGVLKPVYYNGQRIGEVRE
jgi:hypothetical protein